MYISVDEFAIINGCLNPLSLVKIYVFSFGDPNLLLGVVAGLPDMLRIDSAVSRD